MLCCATRDVSRSSDQAEQRPALFKVLLIDEGHVEVAYECESRSEANAWVEEWDQDPMGIVAIVWPAWAANELPSTIGGAA
ncbi:MAG: hypothetical protein ACYC0X_05995 [Pirellulaceae bacterium]